MDFLEPIVEIGLGIIDAVADSSDSPKGCLVTFLVIGAIVGIVALIVWLV